MFSFSKAKTTQLLFERMLQKKSGAFIHKTRL